MGCGSSVSARKYRVSEPAPTRAPPNKDEHGASTRDEIRTMRDGLESLSTKMKAAVAAVEFVAAAKAAAAEARRDANEAATDAEAASAKAVEDAEAAEAAAKLAVAEAEALVAKQEQSLQALEAALAEKLRQIDLRMWVDEFMEADIRTEATTLRTHVQESSRVLDEARGQLRKAAAGLDAVAIPTEEAAG